MEKNHVGIRLHPIFLYMNEMEHFRRLLENAKSAHFTGLVVEHSKDPRKLWQAFNTMLHRQHAVHLPDHESPASLAERFTTFFAEKVARLHSSLTKDDVTSVMSPHSIPPFHSPLESPLTSSAVLSQFEPTTMEEVSKLIKTSPVKSSCLDPLPTWLLKKCSDILLPKIVDIINAALSFGMPIPFKSAVITPLLKKDGLDHNVLSNYRPVSNLPYLSKLVEKVVASRLTTFVEANSLHEPTQSAYRRFHSTETACIRVQNDLLMACDNQRVSILVLLDLSSAFDTIDHGILVHRLRSIGVVDAACDWLQSYLEGRHQSVIIDGVQSTPVPIKTGVPQGSVLGPILFTLYLRELGQLIRSHDLQCHFYADDTQIYGSFHAGEMASFLVKLEKCLDEVVKWTRSNSLCLNHEKTEALIVGTSEQLRKFTPPLIKIGTANIRPTTTVRVLGNHFDCSMTMGPHVSNVCKAGWFHLRTISRLRRVLTQQTCEQLIHSFVSSRIDMGNGLLVGARKGDIMRLQRLLNSAARIVCMVPKYESISPTLRRLHWLKVPERIAFKVALLVFKVLHGMAPSYIGDLVNTNAPSRCLRSASFGLLLDRPFTKLRKCDGSFSVSAANIWNNLPLDVRNATSIIDFKTKLKTHLFTVSYPS